MPKNLKSGPGVGDIVHVAFWDHSNGGDGPPHFEVTGRLTEITKEAYRIHFWSYTNPVDAAADDNKKENEDYWWIVRSAITDIRILK